MGDGAKLEAKDIYKKDSTASLVIYAQSKGDNTGTLNLTNDSGAAFISTGDVTINGGNITVSSTSGNVYIRSTSTNGSVTINGGTVTVESTSTGDKCNASIYSTRDSVTINGGTVNVKSTKGSASIHTGENSTGDVTINGGNISVGSTSGSASIYTGTNSTGSVTISNGTVNVKSTNKAAYIRSVNDVKITGGEVNVESKNGNASIRSTSNSGSVTINGGTVKVNSENEAAYINITGSVTISDGTINVTSTKKMAYIQSLNSNVEIDGGQVTVTGTANNSGISCNPNGSITLDYTNYTDFILASGYYGYNTSDKSYTATTPTIAEGKAFAVMTGDDFTTLVKIIDSSTAPTASELDGTKLVPALTITFNKNGGSGTMTPQKVPYNVAQTLTANTFTRSGYTFNGWNDKQNGTGTSYAKVFRKHV